MFFFFNDTATTEIYTLSLHDALPISPGQRRAGVAAGPGQRVDDGDRVDALQEVRHAAVGLGRTRGLEHQVVDRKSTRLNSSHANISYAVFCLKKKKNQNTIT